MSCRPSMPGGAPLTGLSYTGLRNQLQRRSGGRPASNTVPKGTITLLVSISIQASPRLIASDCPRIDRGIRAPTGRASSPSGHAGLGADGDVGRRPRPASKSGRHRFHPLIVPHVAEDRGAVGMQMDASSLLILDGQIAGRIPSETGVQDPFGPGVNARRRSGRGACNKSCDGESRIVLATWLTPRDLEMSDLLTISSPPIGREVKRSRPRSGSDLCRVGCADVLDSEAVTGKTSAQRTLQGST